MMDYTPGIKSGLYDKYLPDAIKVYGPEDRGSPGPLSATLPQRMGQVPVGPLVQPLGLRQDYARIGLAAPQFAPEYRQAKTFQTGGIGDVQGGWTNVVGPQFQYTPQEQAAMSRQRSFGQSSFGDVGLMPESYRRFGQGGPLSTPRQPSQQRQVAPGTMYGGGSMAITLPNGSQALVGRSIVEGATAGLPADATPQQQHDAVLAQYQQMASTGRGGPLGQSARTALNQDAGARGGIIGGRFATGLSPEEAASRQAAYRERADQRQQMLGAGRNVRANRLYGTPLRPDLFPQVQQMLPGGQTAATITDTDRRIINRFASKDGEIDWSGAINEYRQRGVDPAAAAGKLEQGGLTIADIDEAIAQSSGTFGFGRDDEQIAYLIGLKQALQGKAAMRPRTIGVGIGSAGSLGTARPPQYSGPAVSPITGAGGYPLGPVIPR